MSSKEVLKRVGHNYLLAYSEKYVCFELVFVTNIGSKGKEFYLIIQGRVEVYGDLNSLDKVKTEVKQNVSAAASPTKRGIMRQKKQQKDNQIIQNNHIASSNEENQNEPLQNCKLELINVLQEGDSFGEAALLHQQIRQDTVKCLSRCVFAVLSKDSFQEGLKLSEEKRITMAITNLAQVPLFQQLSPVGLRDIFFNSEVVTFKRGEVVYSAGDPSIAVYVVQSGEFSVNHRLHLPQSKDVSQQQDVFNELRRQTPSSSNRVFTLMKMCTNEVFGEDEIVQSTVRRFEVTCSSFSGNLLRIKSVDFISRIYNRSDTIRSYIWKRICTKIEHLSTKETAIQEQFSKYKNYLVENRDQFKESTTTQIPQSPLNSIALRASTMYTSSSTQTSNSSAAQYQFLKESPKTRQKTMGIDDSQSSKQASPWSSMLTSMSPQKGLKQSMLQRPQTCHPVVMQDGNKTIDVVMSENHNNTVTQMYPQDQQHQQPCYQQQNSSNALDSPQRPQTSSSCSPEKRNVREKKVRKEESGNPKQGNSGFFDMKVSNRKRIMMAGKYNYQNYIRSNSEETKQDRITIPIRKFVDKVNQNKSPLIVNLVRDLSIQGSSQFYSGQSRFSTEQYEDHSRLETQPVTGSRQQSSLKQRACQIAKNYMQIRRKPGLSNQQMQTGSNVSMYSGETVADSSRCVTASKYQKTLDEFSPQSHKKQQSLSLLLEQYKDDNEPNQTQSLPQTPQGSRGNGIRVIQKVFTTEHELSKSRQMFYPTLGNTAARKMGSLNSKISSPTKRRQCTSVDFLKEGGNSPIISHSNSSIEKEARHTIGSSSDFTQHYPSGTEYSKFKLNYQQDSKEI